jgi:hypothetical protein
MVAPQALARATPHLVEGVATCVLADTATPLVRENHQEAQNRRLAQLGKSMRERIVSDLQNVCAVARPSSAAAAACVWHSRRRSVVESLYNRLRGTSMGRLGDTHKAAWWCSCGGAQPVFFATVVCADAASSSLNVPTLGPQQQLDKLLRRWEGAMLGGGTTAEELGEEWPALVQPDATSATAERESGGAGELSGASSTDDCISSSAAEEAANMKEAVQQHQAVILSAIVEAAKQRKVDEQAATKAAEEAAKQREYPELLTADEKRRRQKAAEEAESRSIQAPEGTASTGSFPTQVAGNPARRRAHVGTWSKIMAC